MIDFLFTSCKSEDTIKEISKEEIVGISWLQGKWQGEVFYHGIEKSEKIILSIKNNEPLLKIGSNLCKEKYMIESGDKYRMIKLVLGNSANCITFPKSFSIIPVIDGELVTTGKNIGTDLTDIHSIYVQFPKDQSNKEFSSGFLEKT